jgi:predicted ABC-type ATPase
MTLWLIVLAGPNGSGKSTLAKTQAYKEMLTRHNAEMLNPDEMAKQAPAGAYALIWAGR